MDDFDSVSLVNETTRKIVSMNELTVKLDYHPRVIFLECFKKNLDGESRVFKVFGVSVQYEFQATVHD